MHLCIVSEDELAEISVRAFVGAGMELIVEVVGYSVAGCVPARGFNSTKRMCLPKFTLSAAAD